MKQSQADLSFIVFAATIIATRLFLYFGRVHAPDIGAFDVHHYMYGLILIALALKARMLPAYAIGWGLVVDELMIFPLRATTWDDYFSPLFLLGTLLYIALVYIFREHLVPPIFQKKTGRR